MKLFTKILGGNLGRSYVHLGRNCINPFAAAVVLYIALPKCGPILRLYYIKHPFDFVYYDHTDQLNIQSTKSSSCGCIKYIEAAFCGGNHLKPIHCGRTIYSFSNMYINIADVLYKASLWFCLLRSCGSN